MTVLTQPSPQYRPIVPIYLDLLDVQRETAIDALTGLSEEQAWQRPAKGEWCIGEILNHNLLLMASALPYVRFVWKYFRRRAERRRSRPYQTEIPDYYHDGKFPMWVGFLWTPRYNPTKRVPLEKLKTDLRSLHGEIRAFYEGKDEDILGNLAVYDPYFGSLNLIVTLRLGIYHDQLHYADVIRMAGVLRKSGRAQ